jgi:hypothetical protein
MSDDGTGGGIRIPSMIISKDDGKRLIDFLHRSSLDEINKIAVIAMFDLDKPDNRVEYDYFYTSSNDRALDFLDDFRNVDSKLGDTVLFTPHIVTWSCLKCEKEFTNKHCLAGGKYCAMSNKGMKEDAQHNSLSGRDILMEDLREMCLYKWAYNHTDTQ